LFYPVLYFIPLKEDAFEDSLRKSMYFSLRISEKWKLREN